MRDQCESWIDLSSLMCVRVCPPYVRLKTFTVVRASQLHAHSRSHPAPTCATTVSSRTRSFSGRRTPAEGQWQTTSRAVARLNLSGLLVARQSETTVSSLARHPVSMVWHSSWTRHRMSHPYLGCINPTHSLVQLKSVVFCDKCYNWSKNALPAAFMSECPRVSPGPVGELPQYRKIVRGKL